MKWKWKQLLRFEKIPITSTEIVERSSQQEEVHGCHRAVARRERVLERHVAQAACAGRRAEIEQRAHAAERGAAVRRRLGGAQQRRVVAPVALVEHLGDAGELREQRASRCDERESERRTFGAECAHKLASPTAPRVHWRPCRTQSEEMACLAEVVSCRLSFSNRR